MFGAYRTLLALLVVANHLLSIPIVGHFAVHGFFILSGYLMTYIMAKSYGYSMGGVRSFAINRFLRLYPSYWVVIAVSVCIVLYYGEEYSSSYRRFIFLPSSFGDWFQNLSLVYIDYFPSQILPRLSPPTWALTVELLFYLLIALGVSRSKKMTVLWFALSVAYMLVTHLIGLDYEYRYSALFAGSLPFSIGALIFHYNKNITAIFNRSPLKRDVLIWIALGLFFTNTVTAILGRKFFHSDVFAVSTVYFNYVINALIIVILIDGKFPFISEKFDKFIGDFSYPLYLMHWQVGFFASMILWSEPIRGMNLKGICSFILALVICFLVSIFINRCVDTPIESIRRNIKIVNQRRNNL